MIMAITFVDALPAQVHYRVLFAPRTCRTPITALLRHPPTERGLRLYSRIYRTTSQPAVHSQHAVPLAKEVSSNTTICTLICNDISLISNPQAVISVVYLQIFRINRNVIEGSQSLFMSPI